LKRVQALGINVPEPVAYAFQGRFFYKAWLITKEIEGPERLSDIARKDEPYGLDLTAGVTRMVAQLIEHGIRHVDLHPGNVLVDRLGKVFFVDFDKARFCSIDRHKLTRAYINRWSRAVEKHGLPRELKGAFSLGLTEALRGQ
jgi:tRNA A-37 threonylcarbamoyl transferase component Bud32